MRGVNEVRLLGNLGKDPELRYTPDGKPFARFTLATSLKYRHGDDGELREETTWHNITVWNKLAELCNESLDSGSLVYLAGRIRNTAWEDNEGVKHYRCEVVARDVVFLDKRKMPAPEAVAAGVSDAVPEDIPF